MRNARAGTDSDSPGRWECSFYAVAGWRATVREIHRRQHRQCAWRWCWITRFAAWRRSRAPSAIRAESTASRHSRKRRDLALVLKTGALPAGIKYEQERTVGPSLGADSIREGIYAAIAGLLAVIVVMLVYYKKSGINAVLALLLNTVLLMAALSYFGATLTLPGIAG